MAHSEEDDIHALAAIQRRRSARAPYNQPLILSRERLEAMAASCGTPGGKPDPVMCPSGPIQS